MNPKYLIFVFMVFAAVFTVSATVECNDPCKELQNVKVHAVDNNGDALSGVLVAPEWKLGSSGWNDYFPKEKTTGSDGYATATLWKALKGTTLQVNYATKEGYTCTSQGQTQITSGCSTNTLEVVCTPDINVPEFGLIAGSLAITGAGAGYLLLRRKN